MKIEKISKNKKQFLDLLLLADEQEDMIDRYLENGDLFALYDGDLKSVCVVVPIDSETCELKNIATHEKYQGKGYGRAMMKFLYAFAEAPSLTSHSSIDQATTGVGYSSCNRVSG